jgi:hypothetical protein
MVNREIDRLGTGQTFALRRSAKHALQGAIRSHDYPSIFFRRRVLVLFTPWPIRIGMRILSAENLGELRVSSFLLAGLLELPINYSFGPAATACAKPL